MKTGKMKLIFATNNQHKVDEIRSVIRNSFLEITTLKEAGIEIDIPEPFNTLEENASNKSRTIYELKGADPTVIGCFSEDTGLEVDILHGEPGVKSARYAGESRSFDANIEKLLINLAGKQDRSARFRAVISLLIDGRETLFAHPEAHFHIGLGGMGYDIGEFVPGFIGGDEAGPTATA